MTKPAAGFSSLIRSYLDLRKSIGFIGFALPFVLLITGALQGVPMQSSISQYYHGSSDILAGRDAFVGSLCAIGLFLWFYCGYERRDNIASNVAAISALGVALLPTDRAAGERSLIGILHVVSAALFFLTLAYMSIKLFRLSAEQHPTARKMARNQVYAACGYVIVISVALIALVSFLPPASPIRRVYPIFWLEATAIWAFGISWLTKGEAILKDKAYPRSADAAVRVQPRIPRKTEAVAGVVC